MDSPPQHTDPPSVHARVPQTGPLPPDEPQSEPQAQLQPTAPQPTVAASRPNSVRPNVFMIVGIAILSIGLVALATWTYLSKQNDPGDLISSGQSDLPRDTIAL